MEQQKTYVNEEFVHKATDRNHDHAQSMMTRILAWAADLQKKDRKAKGYCRYCWYINKERIGGQAMTQRACGVCGQEQWYGSTATDVMCSGCAIANDLCKQCGADIFDRPRRKFTHPL